jgi:predicted permease
MVPLLAGSNWGSSVSVQGFEKGPDTDAHANFNRISSGYFRTLGIPLMSGREFTAADGAGAPRVVIVNEAFAKKFNLGREAVGKRMSEGAPELDMEIVGVVQNAKYSEVRQEPPPVFFMPYRQNDRVGSLNFYVRTSLDPEQMLRTAPGVVARLDPNLPLESVKTMPQQARENVFMDRMVSTLSAAFALLATVLAAVGLYGVLAYTVSQRTREIGLRMALGARPSEILGMIVARGSLPLAIGLVVGAVGAALLVSMTARVMEEIDLRDPIGYLVVAAPLVAIALLATYLPARRATQVDPLLALRAD